jgi:hypothetical protein
VMRQAADDRHGWRLRAMIVVLWRAGLRVQEALALAQHDLDPRRRSVLVRNGKGGRRRQVGMDESLCRANQNRPRASPRPLGRPLREPARSRWDGPIGPTAEAVSVPAPGTDLVTVERKDLGVAKTAPIGLRGFVGQDHLVPGLDEPLKGERLDQLSVRPAALEVGRAVDSSAGVHWDAGTRPRSHADGCLGGRVRHDCLGFSPSVFGDRLVPGRHPVSIGRSET